MRLHGRDASFRDAGVYFGTTGGEERVSFCRLLLFVLSGFVIGSSYGDRLASGLSVQYFMWLRLARIYPLHLLVLGVFLVFELMFLFLAPGAGGRQPFTGIQSPPALLQSLLLVQIFFGPDVTPWNGPSWSIAAEIWTYLAFALILRYAWRWLLPICGVIIATAPMFLAFNTDRYINVFHDGAFVRCLFGFALGIVGWRCASSVRSVNLPSWANHVLEFFAVVVTVAFVSKAGAGPLSLAAPIIFLITVLIFARESGLVSRFLSVAPFVALGTLSYSIYMIHGFLYYRFLNGLDLLGSMVGSELVVKAGGHTTVGGSAVFGDAMTILFLMIVTACSFLTFRFIEMPGQAFIGRISVKSGGRTFPKTSRAP